jgi:DNA-directed RNA polymerase subunit RPC12/RpoP
MAGPKIKFRCYQCNQLLGVSRAKAGKVVACPKCSTDLVIPELDDPPPAQAGQPPTSGTAPTFLAALDSGVPVDLADLRPEDIRVVSDDDWTALPIDVDAPRSAPAPAPAPAPEPLPFLAPLTQGPELGDVEIDTAPTPQAIPIPSAVAIADRPVYIPPVPAPSAVESVVPPIRVAAPSIIPERPTAVRSRDLVLPRSVVATWSLLVLVAQAMAFVAGLLVGHFLWRVH